MNCSSFKKSFIIIFIVFTTTTISIYVPGEDVNQKPSFTPGIKTTYYKQKIQVHHNYSKVSTNKNHLTDTQYPEVTTKVYPVYNGHSYSQKPNISEQDEHTTKRPVFKRKTELIEVYSKCPPKVTGQFVYAMSCNQYLNCWKGRGTVQNCAAGTLFNPKTLSCDFPNKVECITGPKYNSVRQRSISQPKSFDQSTNHITEVKQISCPEGFSGLIPNYTDCSKFISCNQGQQFSMDCPAGTLFNINQNVCDFPYKTTCFSGIKGYEKVKYNDFSKNYVKNSNGQNFDSINSHNAQYVSPINFDGSHRSAPLNAQSYYQSQYERNPKSSNSHSQTNSFYQTNYGNQNNQYGVDSKLDLGNGCSSKGKCNQENEVKCPPGFQGFYRHPNNCSKYLSCFNTNTKIESCLPGTRFNPMTGKCDDSNIVNCQTAIKGYQIFNTDQNSQNLPIGIDTYGLGGETQSTNINYHHTNYGRNYDQTGASSNRQYYTTNYKTHEENNQHSGVSSETQQYGRGNDFNQRLDVNSNHQFVTQPNINSNTHQISNSYASSTNSNTGSSYGYGNNNNYQASESSSLHQSYQKSNYGTICNINDRNCNKNNNYGPHQQSSSNSYIATRPAVIKCPDNYNGLTKHPIDCSKFLNCANGQTFIQDCAPGTLFNPSLGNCDFPYKVKCDTSENNINDNDNNNKNIQQQSVNQYNNHGSQNYQGNYQPLYQSSSQKPETNIPIYTNYYHQSTGFNRNDYIGHDQRTNKNQHQIEGDRQVFNKNPLNNYDQANYQPNTHRFYTSPPTQPSTNKFQQNYYQETVHNPPQGSGTIDQLTSQSQTWKQFVPYSNLPNKTLTVQIITPECGRGGSCISSFTTPKSLPLTRTPKTKLPQPFIDQSWSSVRHTASWPPPFPKADPNADYILEYDDDVEEVSNDIDLVAENKNFDHSTFKCSKESFYCDSKNCIPKFWICNGKRDCVNGNDERDCDKYVNKFQVYKDSRLAVEEKQRWDNVSFSTCAMLCLEAKQMHCKSFNYRKIDKTCFLTDTNIGLSGMLIAYYPCDYYELRTSTIDCSGRHRCPNNKCIKKTQLCDGQDDCGDRSDEKNCKPEDFGYKIQLAGSNNAYEGRIEITAFDRTGYICDDKFSILDAAVVCKELGFPLGALDIKGNSHFAKDIEENTTFYLMDDLTCTGNESTILDCDFNGWGVHDCGNKEIAGVICKTTQEKCDEDFWKCDTGNECIPIPFVCDGLNDCIDDSDEAAHHCEAPTVVRLVNGSSPNRGRIEIRHNNIWGTVCDDDFNEDAAKVVCQYLGYKGHAIVVKDGYFGSGEGPIWLDQVRCFGNESTLDQCTHWNWGEHNCDHTEDVGVICTNDKKPSRNEYNVIKPKKMSESLPILPNTCGYRKDNIFLKKDDIHMRVVTGSKANPGDYPWQVSIRVNRGKTPSHWCGGVIISNQWVLTAAHCLSGYSKGVYILTAGDYDVNKDEGTEQNVFIDEFFIHEMYQKGHQMNNDIALIKLKGNGFNLNQDVQPICLPEQDINYAETLNCTISGFGSTQSGSKVSSKILMAAWIPIQKPEICKMPHIYGDNIQEGMFCAGSLEEGADSCDGDSGGPLACLNNGLFTLYGITSWGHHCGYANKPGVYVKVAFYRTWIDEIMNKFS